MTKISNCINTVATHSFNGNGSWCYR